MKLVVCSIPEELSDEQPLVSELFRAGLSTFHLRKPEFSKEKIKDWLELLTKEEQQKVVLHSHWALAQEFPVKGIHLGAGIWKTFPLAEQSAWFNYAKRKKLTISSSVHDQDEIDSLPEGFDYVWLSPIFESISKQGYKAAYDAYQFDRWVKEIKQQKRTPVFGLGGVTARHLRELVKRDFDGAVILGSVWKDIRGIQDKEVLKERINLLISSCKAATIS